EKGLAPFRAVNYAVGDTWSAAQLSLGNHDPCECVGLVLRAGGPGTDDVARQANETRGEAFGLEEGANAHWLEKRSAQSRMISASGLLGAKICRGCAVVPVGRLNNGARSGSRRIWVCAAW